MNVFILNIAFATVFMALIGSGSIRTFLAGFALGYIILWMSKPLYRKTSYFHKLPKVIVLFGFFLKELLISSLKVLWDVITPKHINRPGIIGVPLTARTDLEIFIVANLISLTPGTLTIDVSKDCKTLFVHVMFLDDIDAAKADIKNGLEKRVLEVMRS